MDIPCNSDDNGLDFTIQFRQDRKTGYFHIEDKFGSFRPIPPSIWERIINRGFLPMVALENPTWGIDAALYNAVKLYCKSFPHEYFSLN